jgi:CRP/FNR family transcriptional activator FtrB
MRRTDLAPIRRAGLLSGVPAAELSRMLEPAFVQPLPEAAVLCRQGEKPQFLHIVVAGRVGLFGERGSDEALIEIFGPGDAFIVPAVVLDMPSLLSARLLEEGRILMWPAVAFRDEVRTNGRLAYATMLQVCGYWRLLISQLKDLKLLPATERLSNLLLSLAPRRGGPVQVVLPGNRPLVAGMLGVAPQSLSRAFAALRPLGVSGGGREIAITDLKRLREVIGGPGLKMVQASRVTNSRTDRRSPPPVERKIRP